jgi:SulP family sulfate permease
VPYPASAMSSIRFRTWGRHLAGDVVGGVTGALSAIPTNISFGLVALAPLGAGASAEGIVAMLLGTVIANSLFVSLCRTPGMQSGGSMPMALAIAGVLAGLIEQGVIGRNPADLSAVMAVVIVLTTGAGILTAGLAITGLGRLVPMLPYPVIAGILNGTGVLLVISQYRNMIGLSNDAAGSVIWAHPAALVVSLVTIGLSLRSFAVSRPVPPVIVGLLGGVAVHYAIRALSQGALGPDLLGPVVGDIPPASVQWHAIIGGWHGLLALPPRPVLFTIVPAALSLMMLCALDTLTSVAAMQDISGRHRSAKTDLLAVSIGNIAGGLAGCLPVAGGVNASLVVWRAGGRSRLAGLIRSATIAAVALFLTRAIALLPLAVVAGIVIANGLRLVDRESLRMARLAARPGAGHRAELLGNVLVIAAVMLVAVLRGMAMAVLAGVGLSLLLFAAATAQTAVRRTYVGPIGRSRTRRSEQEMQILASNRDAIAVIELQGALFFGSGEQIARSIERALTSGARHVILDLRRVTSMDVSAARRLLQIAERFWHDGTDLLIASLPPGSPVRATLERLGIHQRLRAEHAFDALEESLDHAEGRLLAFQGGLAPGHACTAPEALLLVGIPQPLIARLVKSLPEVAFEAGTLIIRVADAAGALYVLVEGSVDVLVPLVGGDAPADRRVRLATLTPGTMFGEMALLTGDRRSADVRAHGFVRCLKIEIEMMDRMLREDPEAAYAVMRAIAIHLASKLWLADVAITSYEA